MDGSGSKCHIKTNPFTHTRFFFSSFSAPNVMMLNLVHMPMLWRSCVSSRGMLHWQYRGRGVILQTPVWGEKNKTLSSELCFVKLRRKAAVTCDLGRDGGWITASFVTAEPHILRCEEQTKGQMKTS